MNLQIILQKVVVFFKMGLKLKTNKASSLNLKLHLGKINKKKKKKH